MFSWVRVLVVVVPSCFSGVGEVGWWMAVRWFCWCCDSYKTLVLYAVISTLQGRQCPSLGSPDIVIHFMKIWVWTLSLNPTYFKSDLYDRAQFSVFYLGLNLIMDSKLSKVKVVVKVGVEVGRIRSSSWSNDQLSMLSFRRFNLPSELLPAPDFEDRLRWDIFWCW